MVTISLCMIVKNEEEVIGRCLASVKDVVDEINIIDTGSTDKTKDIVKEYTDRIFDFEWIGDFAAARNYSFEQATSDYILWLDADDIFTDENREKLKVLKETLESAIDAVSMNYNLSHDAEGNVITTLRRYRLVKKENNYIWVGSVHEFLAVSGNLFDSEVAVSHMPLSHDSNRNIRIYEKMLKDEQPFSARDTFYFANELKDHARYGEAIIQYDTFLDSKLGWIEDNIRACFNLADCYSFLEDKEMAFKSSLRSLQYDVPRPEVCCRIGFYFMDQNKNKEAIHWYEKAISYKNELKLSFQNKSFSTWLPHLQLCVLYHRLNQLKKSYEHNEMALKYNPTNQTIINNKKYFEDNVNLEEKTF